MRGRLNFLDFVRDMDRLLHTRVQSKAYKDFRTIPFLLHEGYTVCTYTNICTINKKGAFCRAGPAPYLLVCTRTFLYARD